jgi:hypothetical protein
MFLEAAYLLLNAKILRKLSVYSKIAAL